MKHVLTTAVLGTLCLAGCDKPTVVNVPAPVSTPGPAGATGATGATGAAGTTGATGDTGKSGDTVIAVPLPASSPASSPLN